MWVRKINVKAKTAMLKLTSCDNSYVNITVDVYIYISVANTAPAAANNFNIKVKFKYCASFKNNTIKQY